MADPSDWDYIHCAFCRIRVAYGDDVVTAVWPGGIFTRVFNITIVNIHQARVGTVADTYCNQCGRRLGWQFIEVTQQHVFYTEGRYLLLLDRLSYSTNDDYDGDLTDLDEDGDSNDDQDLGANGQNADQNGVANEQDPGANEQNADQDLGANEQVPIEQNLGANEQNAYQDGGNNQQVPNEQDLGAYEQNVDQDGGGNEQADDDQDGGRPTKRRKISTN